MAFNGTFKHTGRTLTQNTLLHAIFSSCFCWETPSILLPLLYHFLSPFLSYPRVLMAAVSQAAPGCFLGQTCLLPLHLQSPRAPDSRSSKWGYLEGISDPLEVEKNWTAGFRTASSTCGPSVLAGCVFCPPPALGLCKVTGVRGLVSFAELLHSRGFAGLKCLQKLFLLREFYT